MYLCVTSMFGFLSVFTHLRLIVCYFSYPFNVHAETSVGGLERGGGFILLDPPSLGDQAVGGGGGGGSAVRPSADGL